MIELGGRSVSILYADGTSAFFDSEELRLRLEKSFAACGSSESWIAGEIVLAVEYALRCGVPSGDPAGSAVHAEQIDDCVVRILEDSGYPEAARHFRGTTITSGDFGKLSPEDVEQYLADKLQLDGTAGSELAEKIRNALNSIGAAQCSPRLVLELARHFRDNAAAAHRLPVPSPAKPKKEAVLPEENLLQIHRSDSIFPSIRAEINLPMLFEHCTLTPPLTEFSLVPILLPVAEQLDSECRKLRSGGAEKYPLVLTLRGFAVFAAKWLSYEPDTSKEILKKRGRIFASCFNSLLQEKPFKTFMR